MALTYTETYVRPGGSALNSGSTNADAASFTYASGSWVQSTRVFTLASGNTTGLAAGDLCSIYPDGSSTTPCLARISSTTTTTITFENRPVGALPTDGTSNRTVKMGGAWASLRNIVTLANWGRACNANWGDNLRVNVKNGTDYTETTSIVAVSVGGGSEMAPVIRGFTTTPEDGGRAKLVGTTGASYIVLNLSSMAYGAVIDMEFDGNGTTGSADLVQGFTNGIFINCSFANSRGAGLFLNGATAFRCYTGYNLGAGIRQNGYCVQCTSIKNTGSGYQNIQVCVDCIAEENANGFGDASAGGGVEIAINCSAIRNTTINFGAYPQSSLYVDCVGVGASYGFVGQTDIIAYTFGCGNQGHSTSEYGNTPATRIERFDLRTLTANPFTSAPSGSFPKAINLTPASGAGNLATQSVKPAVAVPTSVWSSFVDGYVFGGAIEPVASGGSSIILVEDD